MVNKLAGGGGQYSDIIAIRSARVGDRVEYVPSRRHTSVSGRVRDVTSLRGSVCLVVDVDGMTAFSGVQTLHEKFTTVGVYNGRDVRSIPGYRGLTYGSLRLADN